jgi:endonuclease YncB( thermonuclease family)
MRARHVLPALLVLALPTAAAADWIVWTGGGIRETRGPLDVRGRQVRFHDVNGALMSVPAEDVDVPASVFLSWQVGSRRPARTPDAVPWERRAPAAPEATPATAPLDDGAPCATARVRRVVDSETVELEIAGRAEIVHLACMDSPEEKNRFPQIAWFGLETETLLARLVAPGAAVCVAEEGAQPLRDRAGHRIAYVRLADGRDLGAELVRRGYGIPAAGGCRLHDRYAGFERDALAQESGLWGAGANEVASAVIANALAFHAVGPPLRSGGG